MSQTFAPELSFVPLRHPHEVTNRRSGARLIGRVNNWLFRHGRKTGVRMMAKLDPHHHIYTPKETYTVEVIPISSFQTEWVQRGDKSHARFVEAIDRIFEVMRDRFGLVPYVITRKPHSTTELHWPSAGAHVHYGADLYGFTPNWYRQMERFHRDLATDYANRPYARWLLAHWMGEGSRVIYDRFRLDQRDTNGGPPPSTDEIFSRALFSTSAIESRFMASAKNSYLTFEFRIVGMVENACQLCAAVRLVNAWVQHHVNRVHERARPLRFTLTTARWDRMVTPEGALTHCQAWIEELGLDWADYQIDFFERNLLMRLAHGKME